MRFYIDGDNFMVPSIYFITLVISVHYLVLNMSIGIIFVNYYEFYQKENQELYQQIEQNTRIIKERKIEL